MRAWRLEGRTLVLASDSGAETPSAEAIFRSVVEREPVWPDVEPGPTGAALDIRPSKYPVAVGLMLELGENGLPATLIKGQLKGTEFSLGLDDLSAGHFVEAGTWYPLDPASLSEATETIERFKLTIGPLRSIRQFLDLKKLATEDGPVEDRTGGVAVPPLLFSTTGRAAPKGVDATL